MKPDTQLALYWAGWGIVHGDHWAGMVSRPVANAPKTFFTDYLVVSSSSGQVLLNAGNYKALLKAIEEIASLDEWVPAPRKYIQLGFGWDS